MNTSILSKLILGVFLMFFAVSTSQAQLNKFKKKAQEKLNKNKKEEKKTTETPKPSNTTTTTKPKPAKVALKPLTYERFQPKVSYSTLLRSVAIQPKTGKLYFNAFTISFLPKTEEGGGNATYGTEPNQHKIHAFLKQGDKELAKFVFYTGRQEGPFTEVSLALGSMTAEKEGYVGFHNFTDNADCTLEFLLDDKLIQKFPFKVVKKANSDPYAKDANMFFLEGPWTDFGYIYIMDNKDDNSVYFKFYSRHQKLEYVSQDYFYAVQLYKDGKLFGSFSREEMKNNPNKFKAFTVGAKRIWKRYEIPLYNADAQGTSMFGKHLRKDGNYEVRVTYYDDYTSKGKQVTGPWGQKMDVYAFQIKGGKIVQQGRQDR